MKGISGGYDCQLPLISAIFLRGKVKNFKYLRGILSWYVGIIFCEEFKIFTTFTLDKLSKIECCAKNHNKYVPFLFFSLFRVIFTTTIILEIVTKFPCIKIALNSGFLSLKFIYICNLSSFLQLLALNKA